ncbi:MAG: sensory rhodopsin transducer [Propionicimonas sp.]|nr:sensory rhodopsin transducer [Propionicimonas sp.]
MAHGRKTWYFPDGDCPPEGKGDLKGHESIIILNPNGQEAAVTVRLFFEPGRPPEQFETKVPAESVRCLRTNCSADMGGHVVPLETQYAIGLFSTFPVVAQYGRLDNRQANLAYYTTAGYSE